MAIDLSKAKARERKLLQRKAKLESDIARNKRIQKDAARRLDNKRKIILGGVTMKAVREGVLSESSVRELIERLASDRDKEAFSDFDFGVPETAVSAPFAMAAGD